jgi:hypothetical protein
MFRKEIYDNRRLQKRLNCVLCSFLSSKPEWIPVPIPAMHQFMPAKFCTDELHHARKRSCRLAITEFLVYPIYPATQTIKKLRSSTHYRPTDIPKSRQLIRCRSHGHRSLYGKQAWPKKSAVAHYIVRQHRESAPRAVRVAAAISLNLNCDCPVLIWRVKALTNVEAMLTVLARMTSRTPYPYFITCAANITIWYFHDSGRYVPFLLLRKFLSRGKKLDYRPHYFPVDIAEKLQR